MDGFYTPINDIPVILEERKKDERLVNEIKRFYKSEIGVEPPSTVEGSFAILARQLLINRKETLFCKSIANFLDLDFLVPTYSKDRFVTANREKLSYLKPLFEGTSKPINLISGKEINELDRRKVTLDEIVLPSGQTLFEYHSSLTLQALSQGVSTYEFSKFLNGKTAPEYYAAYLALFGGLNCLLETYHDKDSPPSLKKFASNIFEPAFLRVEKELGIKPLILKLENFEDSTKYVSCPVRSQELVDTYFKQIANL